jgi:thiamine-monophosphate kinase
MDEFALIAQLIPGLPSNPTVICGAGDDCAVLDLGAPERWTLFKTDAVVEGVHFLPDTPPEKIGRKALARALSDIAAMAGTPTAALVTLALPPGFDPQRVAAIYRGLNALAAETEVAVVGGETTTNPDRLLISVSVVGWVPRGRALLRSGARAGDALFVSGELGGALAGRHLDFAPRLAEARWLAAHHPVHALMDVSDGLAGDLRHILHASHVGAELLADAIPISRAARQRAREHPDAKPALQAALTDGEDFELLFTVPAPEAVPVLDGWKREFPGTRLSCIGRITATPGLHLRDRRGVRPLNLHGYVHFA